MNDTYCWYYANARAMYELFKAGDEEGGQWVGELGSEFARFIDEEGVEVIGVTGPALNGFEVLLAEYEGDESDDTYKSN